MNEICIDNKKCTVCCECINVCTHEVLGIRAGKVKALKPNQCIYCEECVDICPDGYIKIEYEELK